MKKDLSYKSNKIKDFEISLTFIHNNFSFFKIALIIFYFFFNIYFFIYYFIYFIYLNINISSFLLKFILDSIHLSFWFISEKYFLSIIFTCEEKKYWITLVEKRRRYRIENGLTNFVIFHYKQIILNQKKKKVFNKFLNILLIFTWIPKEMNFWEKNHFF